MWAKFRLLLWRRQRLVAVLYLSTLACFTAAMATYLFSVPVHIDQALVVAARSAAHRSTLREIQEARRDLAAGRADAAETRLLRLIAEHRDVQPAQLWTHAVVDAHVMLAEQYRGQRRFGRASRVMEAAVAHTPLDYHLWYVKGQISRARGDHVTAGADLREAFLLAPNHPGVTELYLSVLAEANAHERVVWVAEQHARACARAAPVVRVEIGIERPALQRKGLEAVGIPIEHGKYLRSVDLHRIEQGVGRSFEIPREMFAPSPLLEGPLYLQLRFQHVYGGLVITALRYRTESGEERLLSVGPDHVRYLHREHSSGALHAEIRSGLRVRDVQGMEVQYECPDVGLSPAANAIIEKARENLKARPGDR